MLSNALLYANTQVVWASAASEESCNQRAVEAGARFAEFCSLSSNDIPFGYMGDMGSCTLYAVPDGALASFTANCFGYESEEFQLNNQSGCIISEAADYIALRDSSTVRTIESTSNNLNISVIYRGSEASASNAPELYVSPLALSWSCVQSEHVCTDTIVEVQLNLSDSCVAHWQVDDDQLAIEMGEEAQWSGASVRRDLVPLELLESVPGATPDAQRHTLKFRGLSALIKVTTMDDKLLGVQVVPGLASEYCLHSLCYEEGAIEFTSPAGQEVFVHVLLRNYGQISWFIDAAEHRTDCLLLPGSYVVSLQPDVGWEATLRISDAGTTLQEEQLTVDGSQGRRILTQQAVEPRKISLSIPDEGHIVDIVTLFPRPVQCEPGESASFDGISCVCTQDSHGQPLRARLGQLNPSGRQTCEPCPEGTEPDRPAGDFGDATQCKPCDAGYSNVDTNHRCQACPAGSSPALDKSHCVACEPGRYGLDGLSCVQCFDWAKHSISPPAGLGHEYAGAMAPEDCACPPGFFSFDSDCFECNKMIVIPKWISDEIGSPEFMLSPNRSAGDIPESPVWANQTHQTCPGGRRGASPICPMEGYYIRTFKVVWQPDANARDNGYFRLSDQNVAGVTTTLALAVPCHGIDENHCIAASEVSQRHTCPLPTDDETDIFKCAPKHDGMICAGCDSSNPDMSYVRIDGHCVECDGFRLGPVVSQCLSYLLIAIWQVSKSLGPLKQNAGSDTVLFLLQTLAIISQDSYIINSSMAGFFKMVDIDASQSFGSCTAPIGVYGIFFLKTIFVPIYLILCVTLVGFLWNKIQDLHKLIGVEGWITAKIPRSVERELEVNDKQKEFSLIRVVCRAVESHRPPENSADLAFEEGEMIVLTHVGETSVADGSHWPLPEHRPGPVGDTGHHDHTGDDEWYGYSETSPSVAILRLENRKLQLLSAEQVEFWEKEHTSHLAEQAKLSYKEKAKHALWKGLHNVLMRAQHNENSRCHYWNYCRAYVRVGMFIYMPFSRSAMEMLLCSTIVPGGTKLYLKQDLAQTCGTGWHIAAQAASLMLLVLVLFGPIWVAVTLSKVYNGELPMAERGENGFHRFQVAAKHLQSDISTLATSPRGSMRCNCCSSRQAANVDDCDKDAMWDEEQALAPQTPTGVTHKTKVHETVEQAKKKATNVLSSTRTRAKTLVHTTRGDLSVREQLEKSRDYYVDLHCVYHPNRWWWFVMLLMRKNIVNMIYLRGFKSDDNFDWRLTLVLALACFVCLEIEIEPYTEHLDNLMDVVVMIVLIVVLHISASEQFYAGSAMGYGIVFFVVVAVVGLCLGLMTKTLKTHQMKHLQLKTCNELRAKAHRTHKRLQVADENGDGLLDRQEMANLFDKLDKNGDGMVSHKEMLALITELDSRASSGSNDKLRELGGDVSLDLKSCQTKGSGSGPGEAKGGAVDKPAVVGNEVLVDVASLAMAKDEELVAKDKELAAKDAELKQLHAQLARMGLEGVPPQ
eukprot:COSAG02_NODE_497_length_21092_cov_43.948650_4_plen_1489_part_00